MAIRLSAREPHLSENITKRSCIVIMSYTAHLYAVHFARIDIKFMEIMVNT